MSFCRVHLITNTHVLSLTHCGERTKDFIETHCEFNSSGIHASNVEAIIGDLCSIRTNNRGFFHNDHHQMEVKLPT